MRHRTTLSLFLVTAFLGCGDSDPEDRDGAVVDTGGTDAVSMGDSVGSDGGDPDSLGSDGGNDDAALDAAFDAGPVVDDGLRPVLSGFRVEDGEDRLYFDSSEPIRATDVSGFIVSNKTVAGVHINAGSTSAHYLDITEGFTFWDNTTIRYEGGSDLVDLEDNALYEFTLQYVVNNVPEPAAPTERFVSVAGGGSHDGTSEANAWTMAEAGAQAAAGQTVWIHAGDYGNQPLDIDNDGADGSPIKFVGYTSAPGDAPTLTRDQDTLFDDALMPHVHSTSTAGFGVSAVGRHHIIIKNVQITGYQHPIRANGDASEMLIENVYVRGGGTCINIFAYNTTNTRVSRSYVSNCSETGIRVAGDHNQIDDLYVSSRGTPGMDYYISLYGGTIGLGNIVRNSALVRDPSDTHTGHGISLKGGNRPLEHTLIEDCTIHEVAQAIELRHPEVRYTVARGVIATGSRDAVSNLVTFRDDTSYNIIESCIADGVYVGVMFTMNAGATDGGIQAGGHHNRVVNTVFDNCKYGVIVGGIGGTPLESTDNSFEHCTFYDMDYMFALLIDFGNSNTFAGCNISNVDNEVFNSGTPTTSFSNSNSWESWSSLPGENVSADPMFVDASGPDFTPQNPALNTGVETPNVHYDFNGRERVSAHTLGAFEGNE